MSRGEGRGNIREGVREISINVERRDIHCRRLVPIGLRILQVHLTFHFPALVQP